MASKDIVTTHFIGTEYGFSSLSSILNKLGERSGNTNPFAEYKFVKTWWDFYGRRDPESQLHDLLRIMVMRDEGGKTRALFPFIETTKRLRISGQLRRVSYTQLRLAGRIPQSHIIEKPPLLIDEEYAQPVALTLLDELKKLPSAVIEGLPVCSPFTQILRENTHPKLWTPAQPEYVMPFNKRTWEEQRAATPSKIKDSLRRAFNGPKKAGLEIDFSMLQNPDEVQSALQELFILHTARAQRTNGPVHPDHYSSESEREFLRKVAMELAPEQKMMIAKLTADNGEGAETVAIAGIYRSGSQLFKGSTGWKEPTPKEGYQAHNIKPMTRLLAEIIKWGINDPNIESFSFSTGTDRGKTDWGPERVDRVTLTTLPTIKDRAIHNLHNLEKLIRSKRFVLI